MPKSHFLITVAALFSLAFGGAQAGDSQRHIPASASWQSTKNMADDTVYFNGGRTFYCDCLWSSDKDNDGSGRPELSECGYKAPKSYSSRASRIEWEHVVPASLLPANKLQCWREGGREKCERESPEARTMIYDLHNLVPAIGQVNALRSNDLYMDIDDRAISTVHFGQCQAKDSPNGFEPPDYRKGDVARIWFYMEDRYALQIPSDTRRTLIEWHRADPVSQEEIDRNQLIFITQGNVNPFVSLNLQ